MTIVSVKPLSLSAIEQLWQKGELSRGEVISHVAAWLRREIDPRWRSPAEKLVAAVRAECAKFRFPDEDRPELWEALQEVDGK